MVSKFLTFKNGYNMPMILATSGGLSQTNKQKTREQEGKTGSVWEVGTRRRGKDKRKRR
jgi:hypothetical protein